MSANFLDTLRAWGESLFNDKGAWASAQAFPEKQTRILIPASGATGTYTAPYDGYFGFYTIHQTFWDIYAQQIANQGIQTRSHLSLTPDQFQSGSATIPVAKGSTITYRFDTAPGELWFIPTMGAQ